MSSFALSDLRLTDHRFEVPLDHAVPGGERITLYGREVVAAGRDGADRPWLLYLNGGPGHPCQRPLESGAWLGRAVRDYRVLLLDQRGTGRSSPVNRQTLALRGEPAEQAEYLGHFRADAIVRDAELLRRTQFGDVPWSVLGQSYGGFCVLTYLSFAPDGLREAMVTCGLPGLDAAADAVYHAAYGRMERRSAQFYARHPGDLAAARRIAAHLRDHRITLPNGMELTPEAFQALGIVLGFSTGSPRLHYLLEDAFVTGPRGPDPADHFLEQAQAILSFAPHPLYAVMHESIYAQGGATNWSAHRIRDQYGQFDVDKALAGDAPVLFTGEMIYPWMFRSDPALVPLREAADLVAARTDWPALYDAERLAHNEVPLAALVHAEDMYVDVTHSLRTASAVSGTRTWITNEFEHDALRSDGERVIDRLIKMVRDEL